MKDRIVTGLIFGFALQVLTYFWISNTHSGMILFAGLVPMFFIQALLHASMQFSTSIEAVLSSITYFGIGLIGGFFGGGVKGSNLRKSGFSAAGVFVGAIVLMIVTLLVVVAMRNLKS